MDRNAPAPVPADHFPQRRQLARHLLESLYEVGSVIGNGDLWSKVLVSYERDEETIKLLQAGTRWNGNEREQKYYEIAEARKQREQQREVGLSPRYSQLQDERQMANSLDKALTHLRLAAAQCIPADHREHAKLMEEGIFTRLVNGEATLGTGKGTDDDLLTNIIWAGKTLEAMKREIAEIT